MKKQLGLASAALLAATMTACSGSSSSSGPDYCTELKTAQSQLGPVDFSTLTNKQWDARRQEFSKLQSVAPANVKDDWATSVRYFDQFNNLLKSAGLTVEDIKTLQANQLPPGVDKAKVLAIVPKMQQLQSSSDLPAAQQAIRDDAKKQCHITLGTPSPS